MTTGAVTADDDDDEASSAPPRGRGALSRQVIIDAAIALVDEKGLSGLSMRNLGAALGVDAMAIYGYVENKAELDAAVVEQEVLRLRTIPPTDATDPIEFMVHVGRHYRRVLLDHPNLAPLVAARPIPPEDWSQAIPAGITLMRAMGIPDEHIPVAVATIARFIMGCIVQESGEIRHRIERGEDTPEADERMRAEIVAFGGEDSLRARILMRAVDPEATAREFDLGIRSLVRGLLVTLGQPPDA